MLDEIGVRRELRGVAIDALTDKVRVDIAYGCSCTAGKREDFDHYHEVLAWGLDHGLRVPDRVALFLQYGTTAVRDYCVSRGYDTVFERAGARILQPSCGACANCGPGSSTDRAQVTISAINRNYKGRSGPGRLCQALAVTRDHDGLPLDAPPFALVERGEEPEVVATTRIGITKAADRPWRYLVAGSPYVSRGPRRG